MDLTVNDGKVNSEQPFIPCTRDSGSDHTLEMVGVAIGDLLGDGKLARLVTLYYDRSRREAS